jgi:tetratricopeptide (TPR) repeat protein
MHNWALSTISLIYNERFKEAEDEARKIIRRYPSHPAGYFFMAATIDSWMITHQSDKRENEFYRFCDVAVEKGEVLLGKNPRDQWAKFFIGGTEGYKGTFEARYERWITAFRNGWKGVSVLMQMRENRSDIVDIDFGIGCYNYWRSALMKSLWWMPGVSDKRAEGIEKLVQVRNHGVYTKVGASLSLLEIYINERRFGDALEVTNEILEQYPRSRVFLVCKIRILYALTRFEEAQAIAQEMLGRLESDQDDERATIALCHYWIAKTALMLDRASECLDHCETMKKYPYDDQTKKMMEKFFVEAEVIAKQAAVRKKTPARRKSSDKSP